MAGTSLIALIDDIATLLDDIAVMSKVAAKKTAGVLGDDLALNARQLTHLAAERELPVVWAVAMGSLRNKLVLVPAALLISALAPWAVVPLLMLGGGYLCFEGAEKLAHRLLHSHAKDREDHQRQLNALTDPAADLTSVEQEKIRGAIRTDFILSAEIIVIALGSVSASPLPQQIGTLSVVAVAMTIGVYGLVAAIVKLDDAGLLLHRLSQTGRGGMVAHGLGTFLLRAAPWLMKTLAVAGTAAMFMVGGSILAHGVPPLAHGIEQGVDQLAANPLLRSFTGMLIESLIGIFSGAVLVAAVTLGKRFRLRAPQ